MQQNSIENKIKAYLFEHGNSTSRQIAAATSLTRMRVILLLPRLVWQQKVDMVGHTEPNEDGLREPIYKLHGCA